MHELEEQLCRLARAVKDIERRLHIMEIEHRNMVGRAEAHPSAPAYAEAQPAPARDPRLPLAAARSIHRPY